MTPDPHVTWEDGVFPYQILARVGITPESSMQSVQNAFFELIEQGERSHDSRAAWNALRSVSERLWVDLFLHAPSAGQIITLLRVHKRKFGPSLDLAIQEFDKRDTTHDRYPPVLEIPLNDFDDQAQAILDRAEPTFGDPIDE